MPQGGSLSGHFFMAILDDKKKNLTGTADIIKKKDKAAEQPPLSIVIFIYR